MQPKLQISRPGDPLEEEAERIAAQAIQGDADRAAGARASAGAPAQVQREVSAPPEAAEQEREEEDEREEEEEDAVLLLARSHGTAEPVEPPPSVYRQLESGGSRPLDADSRTSMESRLGYDFGKVRIHTDAQAASSARAIGARAYTVGHHVVFGAGEYAPTRREGQRLLAHELVHVVQQGQANRLEPRNAVAPRREAPGVSPPLIARRTQPATGLFRDATDKDKPTPAKSEELPPGVDFQWRGSGVAAYLLVRKSWLLGQGVPESASEVTGARVMEPLLRALLPIVPWLQLEDLTKIHPKLLMHVPLSSKKEIIRCTPRGGLVALLGLPPGQSIFWMPDSSGMTAWIDITLLYRHGALPDDKTVKRDTLNRELLESLESYTGLSLASGAGAGARESLIQTLTFTFNEPLKSFTKAASVSFSRELLEKHFGADAWSEFLKAPKSHEKTGSLKGQAIHLPPERKEDAKELLEILERILKPAAAPKAGGATPEIYITEEVAALLLQIARSPKREAILALLLQGGKQEGGNPQSLQWKLENAIAQQELMDARRRLGLKEKPAPRDQPPIEDRPVHGEIVNRSGYLVPNKEAVFSFEVRDDVGAWRAPFISIQWIAYPEGSPEKAKWIDSEVTNYSPVRSPGLLNDKTFEVTFVAEGTYIIEALVNHNFFRPKLFTRRVKVRSEESVAETLREDALSGFRQGPGTTTKHQFDVGFITGAVTQYEEGTITRGKLAADFKAPTLEERLKSIDAERDRLRELIKNYEGRKDSESSSIREWAESYLKTLDEGREKIAKEAAAPATTTVPCRGVFVSRVPQIPSGPLNLLCHFTRSNGQYIVTVHDITQLFERENYRVQESGPTFEAAVEKAFLSHAVNYPNGTLSIAFQGWDEQKQALNDQYVDFSKVTDTLAKDIKSVVFDTAVDIGVNIVAAVLTLFPPTTAVGLTLAIAYNSAKTLSELEERYSKGTLREKDVAVGLGMIALDLLPVVGKSSKLITLGRKSFLVIEGVQIAGMVAFISADGMKQVAQLRNGIVRDLAVIEKQIRDLEQVNLADPQLEELRKQREMLIQEGREATAKVFAQIVATQGLILVGGAMLQEIATRKFGLRVNELKKKGLFEHEEGRALEYDYTKKRIVGDEKSFTPAQLEQAQKTAYYDQSLGTALPDTAARRQVVEILHGHDVEIRPGGKTTRLEQVGDKWVLRVADGAKPADILAEAYRVKSGTAVVPAPAGKARTPVQEVQHHQGELTHLEELRKRVASKEAALDSLEIDTQIRNHFKTLEQNIQALPKETRGRRELEKWLADYRQRVYEPATKLHDRLKAARGSFYDRFKAFNARQREHVAGMSDEGMKAFAYLKNDQQESFLKLGDDVLKEFNANTGSRQVELLKEFDKNPQAFRDVQAMDVPIQTDAGAMKKGHTFSEHGAHLSDTTMFGKAAATVKPATPATPTSPAKPAHPGNPKSRWKSFEEQNHWIEHFRQMLFNPTSPPSHSAINSDGWKQIAKGKFTVNDVVSDPTKYKKYLKEKVEYKQELTGRVVGEEFHPDGRTRGPVDRVTVVFLFDHATNTYKVLTAFPENL
ncbi:MAG: DUF4157 domain-containing protein [Myxococcaceae bacterium]|nr:DUF4157 domain-containing protein [Myxococcaceae bacterium]